MKRIKVMMFTIIILLVAVITETYVICKQNLENSKDKENIISRYENAILNESATNTNVLDNSINCIENILVENTLASVENVISLGTTSTDIVESKALPGESNIASKPEENKKVEEKEVQEPVKTEEISVCAVQEVVTSTQVEIPTPIVNVEPEKENNAENVPSVVGEEYKYNDNMTQTIVNIINNNPSQYMIQDGFSVVVDSSITSLTNQFTFSEQRVINKISAKAGTIKVYAQDYYLNGELLFTECYIF